MHNAYILDWVLKITFDKSLVLNSDKVVNEDNISFRIKIDKFYVLIITGHCLKSLPTKKMEMGNLNIVIITFMTILVVILLSIIIWVCFQRKNKVVTLKENVDENYYYEGFEGSTVDHQDKSNVVDENDYYKNN